MNEHDVMVTTLCLVCLGFILKGFVFGSASGIMIYQKGTSRLANAVKWFFIVMAIQDICFAALYAVGAYEASDPNNRVVGVGLNNLIRVSGVLAIFSVCFMGAYFILVLSKRVRVLIDYEEADRMQDRKWLKD